MTGHAPFAGFMIHTLDLIVALDDSDRNLNGHDGITMDRTRVHAHARNLEVARNHARGLVRSLDRAPSLGLTLGRDRIFNEVCRHANVLARTLDHAHRRAREIAHSLDHAHDGLHDHARNVAQARDTAYDIHNAVKLLSRTTNDHHTATESARECPVRVTTWFARHLATVAAKALPTQHQARYAEEFSSELWDLAALGTGRWGQVACATRQFSRAFFLRGELQTPHRRKASQ